MTFRRTFLKSAAVAALAFAVAAPAAVKADEPIPVVATFSILGDMVKQIGGDKIALTTLVDYDGDAHVYQPTPADAKAVNGAQVLFVNGLEFEGWLDRLVDASGFKGTRVVATEGIEAIPFGETHAFEWAGTFDLKPGTYNWSFAKVGGDYADPAMRMVILESGDIEATEEAAEEALEADAADAKKDGDVLTAQSKAYSLNFDASKDMTVFPIEIKKAGKYTFYTEHMPFEFEDKEHFFKDLARADVEPIAQEPDAGGHDDHHGHDDHAKHDDHDGHGHGAHAFEWAGTFDLKAGSYKWSFAKVGGDYADPAMKMVILKSGDIEASESKAEASLESGMADSKKDGDVLVAQDKAYSLNFDGSKNMTVFTVDIKTDGKYTFYTEHMPFEFEDKEHFFKDLARADVEPVAQEPDAGHDHAHGDHGGHDDHAGHHHHHHGAFDPHSWQSIANAIIYVDNITKALVAVDPANAAAYKKNQAAYVAELKAVEAEIIARIGALPETARTIVTAHDAFGYYADAYGLKFKSPTGVSTEAEASAADVAKLITQIREEGIAAVFVENIADNRLLEQISRETGAKIGGTLFSDALSAPDGPAATYIDMMRHNTKMLSQALGS